MLTIQALAAKYNLSPNTIKSALRRGRFPAQEIKGGGSRVITWQIDDTTTEFKAWLKKHNKRISRKGGQDDEQH